MVNYKQFNRLASKVARLESVYRSFVIERRVEMSAVILETAEHILTPPAPQKMKAVSIGESWGGDFTYAWFHAEADMPSDFLDKPVYLELDNGAVENLVFFGGVPYGMTDYQAGMKEISTRLHRYLRLTDTASAGRVSVDAEGYAGHKFVSTMPYDKEQSFCYSGIAERPQYRGIYLVTKREEVETFCDRLALMTSLFQAQEEGTAAKNQLLYDYEELFCLVDLMPDDGLDLRKINRANAVLERILATVAISKTAAVSVVGHSHLDTAWLWKVEETVRKNARTVATAVRLLKRYPEYRFVMSSVLHLHWLEVYYPALFSEVVTLAKAGRFEFTGGSWVECDCNLVGGESLVRQFVRGQRYLREHIGKTADCFWLPDTFGYSASLPQVLKACGIGGFVTTKMSWNDTNVFPYSTFLWKGIDGTETLAHLASLHCWIDPVTVRDRKTAVRSAHTCDKALVCYGYGDGGGGPDEKMVERAIATTHLKEAVPSRHSTVRDFMQSIDTKRLPHYNGELYLELHRGTLTTNHDLKKLNRTLERLLHNLDFALCVCKAVCKEAERQTAARLLDVLLLNQFHDILPGTCITEVNTLAKTQLQEACAEAEQLTRDIFMRAVQKSGDVKTDAVTFVNASPVPFFGAAAVSGQFVFGAVPTRQYATADGQTLSQAELSIPPYSSVTIPCREGKAEPDKQKSAFLFDGKTLDYPAARVTFDADMNIVGLFDKCACRELAAGGGINVFSLSENVPAQWDNWDVDADFTRKAKPVGTLVSCETIYQDGARLRLRIKKQLTKTSRVEQDTVFYADTLRIDFETVAEWHERHKFLRVLFDTQLSATHLKSEIQWGHLERPTHKNTSLEQARFIAAQQKWSYLGENGYGLALLNDCKYGVSCTDGLLGLSLFMSGTHPDTTADEGRHTFCYSLIAADGFDAQKVIVPAYNLNNPPVTVRGALSVCPIASVDAPNVLIETVKPAEVGEGTVLRLYECLRLGTQCTLIFDKPVDVSATDMTEIEEAVLARSVKKLTLNFRAFEIKTLKITAASKN